MDSASWKVCSQGKDFQMPSCDLKHTRGSSHGKPLEANGALGVSLDRHRWRLHSIPSLIRGSNRAEETSSPLPKTLNTIDTCPSLTFAS